MSVTQGRLKATVMDADQIRRSLSRIAHEIAERNRGIENRACTVREALRQEPEQCTAPVRDGGITSSQRSDHLSRGLESPAEITLQ